MALRGYRPNRLPSGGDKNWLTQARMDDLAYLTNPAGKTKGAAGNVTFDAKDTSHILTGTEAEATYDTSKSSATSLLEGPA